MSYCELLSTQRPQVSYASFHAPSSLMVRGGKAAGSLSKRLGKPVKGIGVRKGNNSQFRNNSQWSNNLGKLRTGEQASTNRESINTPGK